MSAPGLPVAAERSENPVLTVKSASSESNSASDPSKSDAGKWQTPESDDTTEDSSERREHASAGSAGASFKENKSKSESDSSASTDTINAENRALRMQLRHAQAQVKELEDTITLLSTSLEMLQQESAATSRAGNSRMSHAVSHGMTSFPPSTAGTEGARRPKRARSLEQEDVGRSGDTSMERISVLAAAALETQQAALSPEPSKPTEPSAATRRSLRTASNMSSSSAKYSADHSASPTAADGVGGRIKGKMTQYERDLVDGFVADVKSGAIIVPKGSLARMLQEHVNKSRHITFFEKLVSRRKLNQELAPLFAPREPRAGDKTKPQPGDAHGPEGGQKRKRGRRRRSAKEALLSLLDNPELVSLMQQGGLMGGTSSPMAPPASLQLPHGLPAAHPHTASVPHMLPPQVGHAPPPAHAYAPSSGATPLFLPPAGYFGAASGVPTPALPSGPVGYTHGASMPNGVPPNMRFAPAFAPPHGGGIPGTSGPSTMGMPASGEVSMPMVPPHLQQHGVYWGGPHGLHGPVPHGSAPPPVNTSGFNHSGASSR